MVQQYQSGAGSEFPSPTEPHLNGRSDPLAAGKVLGGGSSINAMAWARGHKRTQKAEKKTRALSPAKASFFDRTSHCSLSFRLVELALMKNKCFFSSRSMESPKRKRFSEIKAGVFMVDQVKSAILKGTAVRFDLSKGKGIK
jgi:hypothetical protein